VRFLNALLDRHGVPPLPDDASAELAMASWTDEVSRKQVELALRYPIRLIANALGPPPRDVIELCHRQGVKVAALVGSKGSCEEAGGPGRGRDRRPGHRGRRPLRRDQHHGAVPEVIDAGAPVIAAGGIGSGKPARQLRTPWSDAWDDPKGPAPPPPTLAVAVRGLTVAAVPVEPVGAVDPTMITVAHWGRLEQVKMSCDHMPRIEPDRFERPGVVIHAMWELEVEPRRVEAPYEVVEIETTCTENTY
jgi:hypothetical protein